MDTVDICATRFTEGQVITIKLEDTEETFLVQRALLCCASEYFITALEGRFKEGIEQILRLPGCDTETIKLFLYWIGYHQLPDFNESEQEYTPELAKLQARLVKLWCFADACLMPKLQNEAMKALLSCLNHSRVSVEALRLTFANTAADSTLRKAISDEFLYDYVISVEGSGCKGDVY